MLASDTHSPRPLPGTKGVPRARGDATTSKAKVTLGLDRPTAAGETAEQRGHRAVRFEGWGRETSVQIWTKVWARGPKAELGTELMSISSACGSATRIDGYLPPRDRTPPSLRPPSYGRGGESGFGTRTSSPGSSCLVLSHFRKKSGLVRVRNPDSRIRAESGFISREI